MNQGQVYNHFSVSDVYGPVPEAHSPPLVPLTPGADFLCRSTIHSLKQVAEDDTTKTGRMIAMDTNFFVIPDDETRTIVVCPTEEQYSGIRLNREKARIMADIILRQIENWR